MLRACLFVLGLLLASPAAHAQVAYPPVDTSQFVTSVNGQTGVITTDLGNYAVASLPTCGAGQVKMTAWATDLFGGPGDRVICDGSSWKPVRPLALLSASSSTMTATTLLTAPTIIVTGTIGTAVTNTITLSTTYAYKGAKFRVLRKATGLGALVVAIGTSINLSLSSWADFEYDGSAWVETASGGLL